MNLLTRFRDWWFRPVTDRLDHLPSGPLHPSTVALADRWAEAIAAWPNRDRP